MKATLTYALLAVMGCSSLAIGCGGRNSGGAQSPGSGESKAAQGVAPGDDKGRCEFKNRSDREESQVAGPGSIFPNVRRVYQIVGQDSDNPRRVLVCREVDTNRDGIKDVFRFYDEHTGDVKREEADSNYDGKLDVWATYANGHVVEHRKDRNHDGQPEEWKFYRDGKLIKVQLDTNNDRKPDVWEYYVAGHLERIGRDLDYSGDIDEWVHDEVAAQAAKAKEKAERKKREEEARKKERENASSKRNKN